MPSQSTSLECDHTLESNPSVLWYLHTFTQPTMAAHNRDAHEDLKSQRLAIAQLTASLSSRVTGVGRVPTKVMQGIVMVSSVSKPMHFRL